MTTPSITLHVYDLIDVAEDHVMQLVVPTNETQTGTASASHVTVLHAPLDASIWQLKQIYFDRMAQARRRAAQELERQEEEDDDDDDLDGTHRRRTSKYAPRHMRWIYLTNLARPPRAPRLLGDLDDAKTLDELGVCDQSWICAKSRWIAARGDSDTSADTSTNTSTAQSDLLAHEELEDLIESTRCMNKPSSADDDDEDNADAANNNADNDADAHAELLDDDGNVLSEEHDWYYLEMRRRAKEREQGGKCEATTTAKEEEEPSASLPNETSEAPQWQL